MKQILSKEIQDQLRQIDKLMDLRISQIKAIDPLHWWEISMEDKYYKFLCKQYAHIRCMETNPKYEITEEEKKMLLSGLQQSKDIKEVLV